MQKNNPTKERSAFTLIELLVVIAIIAILAVVVVLVLNPAQLLAQSRDANRVQDMATLSSAVSLYETDGGSFGSMTSTYISIPDTTSTCANVGFPSGFSCVSSTVSRDVDGTGWIPLNFKNISSGSPFGSLPMDPSNTSSSGLYYSYMTNGTSYELIAGAESEKYRNTARSLGGGIDVQGSMLSGGLVAWWPLNEGSGNIIYDRSGNGNNGMASGTVWTAGISGNALSFGGNSYVSIPEGPSLDYDPVSFSLWVDEASSTYGTFMLGQTSYGGFLRDAGSGQYEWDIMSGVENNVFAPIPSYNQWHFLVGTYDGVSERMYIDGQLAVQQSVSVTPLATSNFGIGACLFCGPSQFIIGDIFDARIYNRALSPAEVMELYNAEK